MPGGICKFCHFKKSWFHYLKSAKKIVFQDESDNYKLSKVSDGPPVGGPLSDDLISYELAFSISFTIFTVSTLTVQTRLMSSITWFL